MVMRTIRTFVGASAMALALSVAGCPKSTEAPAPAEKSAEPAPGAQKAPPASPAATPAAAATTAAAPAARPASTTPDVHVVSAGVGQGAIFSRVAIENTTTATYTQGITIKCTAKTKAGKAINSATKTVVAKDLGGSLKPGARGEVDVSVDLKGTKDIGPYNCEFVEAK